MVERAYRGSIAIAGAVAPNRIGGLSGGVVAAEMMEEKLELRWSQQQIVGEWQLPATFNI